MATKESTGLRRILNAYKFSWNGYKAAYKYEAAFREETWALIVLTPVAFFVGENAVEWILLIGCLVLPMIIELLNSAIEAVVDRIGPEHHELSGRAKDMGSAAVMLAVCLAWMTWLLILFT